MKRIILIVAATLLLASIAHAQAALTTAQVATLRTNILADGTLTPKCTTSGDGPFDIATAYNLPASPGFTVWKSNVTITQIGDKINGAEMAGLSTLNATRLQTVVMMSPAGLNPALADRRAFFDDIFSGSGGAITRPALLALYKRSATRAEKLFATGTGTDASPATLVFEGNLGASDVQRACNQ